VSSRGKAQAPHLAGTVATPRRATVDIENAGNTPILRQYREVKARHPDELVFVRLGDFFELLGPDAEAAAPVLGVSLTGRSFGSAGRVPMCGVPHQALTHHVRRLLGAGFRVAVWDQVGDAVAGKLVERRVTRVLSAGTVVDEELLDASAVQRCAALVQQGATTGIAALDASTGDCELVEIRGATEARISDELRRLDAAELVVADDSSLPETLATGVPRAALPSSVFSPSRAEARVLEAAGSSSLVALGLEDVPVARVAAGAVLAYCERSQLRLSPELLRFRVHRDQARMVLDEHTRRNLELVRSAGTGVSLVELLDSTRTPMGSRLLRAWVQTPLLEVPAIVARADAVEALSANAAERDALRTALRAVRDLERLVARCVQGGATPRDLSAVRDACAALPVVRASVAASVLDSSLLHDCAERGTAPGGVLERLRALLVDEPPGDPHAGGAVRDGADAELDRLRASGADARTFIAALEAQERERTGMRSLRVGYNRVFGYYIEVPNGQRDGVPAAYERKQTLVGAERYTTPDLKKQEAIVLHSRERALAREQELLREAAALVASHAGQLLDAARAAATLDALQSLATIAAASGWVRPVVDDSEVIDIEQGRHPLVERALGPGRFVANDCSLDVAERVLILTGPNMAGKSTYLRQIAVSVVLAQIGSFIPAQRARIGVCDRVFTRIGAQDDLSGGMSTFMVEMAETAAILRQASSRSLVILDEIGRGTSTYDGLSIARAVVEHLHDSPQLGCRTLFATHYHELTTLESTLHRVRNARVEVVEEGERVTFLHRIVPGGADRSFGIHVARLAGVPSSVLLRARTLLAEMERTRPLAGAVVPGAAQLSLDIPAAHPVVEELATLDIDSLSPLAALNALADLKQRAET
jgi:DNA mismatch repair protein MutS